MKIGLFGLVYTVVYFFLAVAATGGGHGNFIFLAPLFSWVLLFPALFLLTKINKRFIYKAIFVVLMLLHYAHIIIFLRPLFSFVIDPIIKKDWDRSPEIFFILPTLYLAGQLVIWLIFFKSSRNREVLK
jgi:hypothetical protein